MARCPVCERLFDERRYQVLIAELGAFDSVACAEEALRRSARDARKELPGTLLEAVQDRERRRRVDSVAEPRALRREPRD
jgi:hypothetical protein